MEHSFFLTVYTASFFLPTWKAHKCPRLKHWSQFLGEGRDCPSLQLPLVRGVGLGIPLGLCLYVGVIPSGLVGLFPAPSGQGAGPDCRLHFCTERPFRVSILAVDPGWGA